MNMQNQVILSIGSNQGEKLATIKKCIDLIHNKIGTVVRVSKLYESPSWGFDSDDFYNCAVLLHSNKAAEIILSEILNLEKQ